MKVIKEPICYKCMFFYGDWTCKAYPKGIPKVIKDMDIDHSKQSYKNDNGIMFNKVRKGVK
ncbi:hypothetical protein M0R19_04750 [Candidatus Pacearchaeota archaeon]|jgi:hypothetical protein|nr:hypothetical protein [Candidatus Pacearchaeota archaeon]